MNDTVNNVIDARLSETLGTYFNGVTLQKTVGDCAILSGVRKQNGAPVAIYTPSFSVARDEGIAAAIGKDFATYDRIGNPHLQASERLLTSRAFRKTPALAVLACPVPVFDEAFDTLTADARLRLFDQVLDGLAALHAAGLVHGNLSAGVVRRETEGGVARLTELTFSGDRSTTVTAQPLAYQSRHVINTTQPRAEDDVHAAGMLGYRILLGPDGPAIALTGGPADGEALTAAILGEPREAPGAEQLFPDGHPKAEQVARLLARMTGRLPNAAPYSSAEAARRAFQSVLSGESAPEPAVSPAQAHVAPARAAVVSAPAAGVSKATALMLFGGFLVSTAAACYFYLAHESAADERDIALLTLERETARFAGIDAARQALRSADRALTAAAAQGAETASAEASAALESARTALGEADGTVADRPGEAADLAERARGDAEAALKHLAAARSAAEVSRRAATEGAALAELAVGAEALSELRAGLAEAETAFAAGEYEAAGGIWAGLETGFAEQVTAAKAAAEAARERFTVAGPEAGGAAAVLARSYASRAENAEAEGRFSEAAALYEAALAALGTREETAPADAVERRVTIGDDAQALVAALALCREAAPITASACPESRAAGEAAREAVLTPYEMDATEVSVAEFERFVTETGHVTEAERAGRIVALTSSGEARLIDGSYSWASPDGAGSRADPARPVTVIALNDARAYCDWAGGRLPTEAEWEAAGRGESGRAFPWGDWTADAPVWRGAPTPARRLPVAVSDAGGAGPEGHEGLSGNAREWVMGAEGAVLKGGSWNTANPADLRLSARLIVPGNAPGVDFGFRCARDLEAWK